MSNEEIHPTLTPIGHQHLRVGVTWAMRRTHPTLPYPHQSSAVESWSNMSNEDPPYPTPHQSSAVESWSGMSNEETHPTLTPIGHQQLRVEVTWAMRRTHPTVPPHHIGHYTAVPAYWDPGARLVSFSKNMITWQRSASLKIIHFSCFWRDFFSLKLHCILILKSHRYGFLLQVQIIKGDFTEVCVL